VPAAIHVSPESHCAGPLAKVRDGDVIRLDARNGSLQALVDDAEFRARPVAAGASAAAHGSGRELFAGFRAHATDAESGARTCNP
jgi:phosphogluconate dehydratase